MFYFIIFLVNYVTPIGSFKNSSSKNQQLWGTLVINKQGIYLLINDEENKHHNDDPVDSTQMTTKSGKKLNVSLLSEDPEELKEPLSEVKIDIDKLNLKVTYLKDQNSISKSKVVSLEDYNILNLKSTLTIYTS